LQRATHGFGDLLHLELLDLVKDEHGALVIVESVQDGVEEFSEFALFELLEAVGRDLRDGWLRRGDFSADVGASPMLRRKTNGDAVEPRAHR
jgi:hypothetical protein